MSLVPINLQYKDFKFIAYKENSELWFVAKAICDYLEYSNSRMALKSHCKKEGVRKIYTPTSSGFQDLQYINRSNVIRLIMRSKKEEAIDFQDWIIEKVIPSILDNGNYSVFENSLAQHTDRETQIKNSKTINSLNYKKGGREQTINYNRENCLIHTGLTPSKVIEMGKQLGLKGKKISSAKEVLRNVNPPIACTMSFADNLIKTNPDKTLLDIKSITLKSISVYDEMLKAGIIPIEFTINNN